MKHRTLEEITRLAQVEPVDPHKEEKTTRRQKLERLASLLDAHRGSIRLFSMIEYAPAKQRMKMRQDNSPLTIAFQDSQFRQQGLRSDVLGDAIGFFELSMREAHHLFCDCHYSGTITPGMIATRVRSLAQKRTFAEIWRSFRERFARA